MGWHEIPNLPGCLWHIPKISNLPLGLQGIEKKSESSFGLSYNCLLIDVALQTTPVSRYDPWVGIKMAVSSLFEGFFLGKRPVHSSQAVLE